MPAVNIRSGQAKDLEEVKQLLTETWQATYKDIYSSDKIAELTGKWHNVEILAAELNRQENCFLVAELDNKLAGHLLATKQEGGPVMLRRLYVLPVAQGRGLGKSLFGKMLELLPDMQSIELEVEPENNQARRFYQRLGFLETGQTNSCGGDSGLPALIMEKRL